MSNYVMEKCAVCGASIYAGDHYYEILGDAICDRCVEQMGTYAEEPDWDAVRYDDERGDRCNA